MLRIGICEDSPVCVDRLLALLNRYSELRPGAALSSECFYNAEEITRRLADNNNFDLLILDILMPDKDGMTLARELRRAGIKTRIVFTTQSPDFALEAFGVKATQYLLKPVSEDALFKTLDQILETTASPDSESRLLLHIPGSMVSLPFSTIICVESIKRTLRVYLEDGKIIYSRTLREPLAEAVAPLLEDARFLHAHKSFVLNMEHVESLTNTAFIMKSGLEVPVPRYKLDVARKSYMDFLSRY